MVALAGPFRSGMSAVSHSHHGMRLSAHIHHSTGRRMADPGQAEHHQQREHLRRAPRPAAPPLSGYQRGQQQRQPPDPPGQQRIPGRQRQRRHHRHGQQHLPRLAGSWNGVKGTLELPVHAGQVDHAQRQRRHGSALDRPGAATAGATMPGAASRAGQHLDQPAPRPARHPAGAARCPCGAGHPFHDLRVGRRGRPLITPAWSYPGIVRRRAGPDYLRGMTADPAPWCDDPAPARQAALAVSGIR